MNKNKSLIIATVLAVLAACFYAINIPFSKILLGFVAYGLSIFMYVRAQRNLDAAKTSAWYALAPFIGGFLSFVINKDVLTLNFVLALAVMIAGTVFIIADTLKISK